MYEGGGYIYKFESGWEKKKIEGKENIENIKGGAISVSNHVLFLDCAMIGLAYGKRKIYYTTQEGSFKITNVPIILIVCTFREPKGIRKILKKKKDVTLKILEPINPQTEKKNRKEESENLKEKVFLEMKRRSWLIYHIEKWKYQ